MASEDLKYQSHGPLVWYFILLLCPFWSLKALVFIHRTVSAQQKYSLVFHSQSYSFGTTWRSLNDDRMFFFYENYPFKYRKSMWPLNPLLSSASKQFLLLLLQYVPFLYLNLSYSITPFFPHLSPIQPLCPSFFLSVTPPPPLLLLLSVLILSLCLITPH